MQYASNLEYASEHAQPSRLQTLRKLGKHVNDGCDKAHAFDDWWMSDSEGMDTHWDSIFSSRTGMAV